MKRTIQLNRHSVLRIPRSEESSQLSFYSLSWKIATSLTFLAITFFFLVSMPSPAFASHCEGLDLNDPNDRAECASNSGDAYCEGTNNRNRYRNEANGTHTPILCSIGEECVMVGGAASCTSTGLGSSGIGAACTFPQQRPNEPTVTDICNGKMKVGPNGTLTCQYDSSVSSDCHKSGTVDQVFGRLQAPSFVSSIGFGAGGISTFLGNLLELFYIAGILIFVFMIVFSAVQWIASGGDKEKYGKARERLTHAVIGIALLGLAGVIITFVGGILNFKFFG